MEALRKQERQGTRLTNTKFVCIFRLVAPVSTVNISFNDDLLKQIDQVAQQESRSRSELIREAARSYIDRRRRWAQIVQVGRETARSKGLVPQDIEKEIASFRKEKRK